jgi:N-alpha-acetyltransferase 15/16, NatA auxiliary subunit
MAGAKKAAGSGGGGPDKDALPAKEQALFRSIVKFYDSKQYKKGVKAADAVLK